MIFNKPSHIITNALKSVAKIKAVLDIIEGNEVDSKRHTVAALTQYSEFRTFSSLAVSYGMLICVNPRLGGFGEPTLFFKTNLDPVFIDTTSKKEVKPVKPKGRPTQSEKTQGNGSVVKPKFNYPIAKKGEPNEEIYRKESYGKSKLSLMAKIDDIGGYDQESRLERLRDIRRGT